MQESWHQLLQEARKRLSISQAELASRVGLSREAISKYETGQREPRRSDLVRLLDGLKLELRDRNRILTDAGFKPIDTWFPPDEAPNYWFTVEEAAALAEERPWPSFVVNTLMEVLAANRICQTLWGVDLRHEYTEPVERNLLSVASNPRFADKVLNWDEAMASGIGVVKGHFETLPEGSSPYYAAVMKLFQSGDPQYMKRFLNQWERTPARSPKVAWTYKVTWDEPNIGVLRFLSLVNVGSEPEGFGWNDWIPVDAESWMRLEMIKAEKHPNG
jgi:transcriptional regulator with XRE-family HTH domain